ncbi:MAG: FAD-dependent oxidoreductase [Candidatus Bipolaricaulota bacterium]|nr:FAD-dependent oxidoreductase [Candidatus Bipolaricaulota bacterium]MDW8127415.1 FAD-dependent oxidoreductase [Candidatus Bipolaricaulota bacterium]
MRYVIVGGGIAGVAAAQKLRTLDPAASVVLVEAEAVPYYLRPGLIEILAGKKELQEITPYPREWFEKRGIEYRLGETVVALDLSRKEIVLSSGKRLPFDRLLLATGAEPVRPPIPGVDRPGVFTLRTAADVERIRTWAEGKKSAVVLGGGWLGLEAAHALRASLEKLVVLDRGPWPLARQLDREAGQTLAALLREKGLEVRGGVEAAEIRGATEVQAVRLTTGEILPADLVLIAVGVRPRLALAKDASISVNQGVVVDDFLETSAPGVYAAGDVAEWQGKVYGIIPAAREQALLAAQNMVEPGSARYLGTNPAQRLKVAGIELLVLGETQPAGKPYAEERVQSAGRYAKLVVDEKRHLVGAIVLGYPELMSQVEELFQSGRSVPRGFL